MARQLYLDLAAKGLAYPIGTDLVLHEKPDAEGTQKDGKLLGQVVAEAARRYRAPLAVPLMDLRIEKSAILSILDVPENKHDSYHFSTAPSEEMIHTVEAGLKQNISPRMQVTCDALAYVASQPDLVPVGMCIGPFSLMTKLLSDPITPVYMAGSGVSAADDPEVAILEATLELGTRVLMIYIAAQIKAGASGLIVCEPAANSTYLSPMQIEAGADIYERFVLQNLRRLKTVFDQHGADFILHDCGELTNDMVRALGNLEPTMLSLGSSRKLWEDAPRVPKHVVLYGNLPTKQFYSDALMPKSRVVELTQELLHKMKATGHPYILGSECDVLSVVGHEKTIREKVGVMLETAGQGQ